MNTQIVNETHHALTRQDRNHRPAFQLWVLLFLFILRVAGQLMVATGWGWFLPPMDQWYSGLLPYRYLLPAQLLIIVLYGKVCLSFTRGQAFWLLRGARRVVCCSGSARSTSQAWS